MTDETESETIDILIDRWVVPAAGLAAVDALKKAFGPRPEDFDAEGEWLARCHAVEDAHWAGVLWGALEEAEAALREHGPLDEVIPAHLQDLRTRVDAAR